MTIEPINPNGLLADRMLWDLGELAIFLGGSDDSWTGDFLRLLAKSDPQHYAPLAAAFPWHARAYAAWRSIREPSVGALTAALLA